MKKFIIDWISSIQEKKRLEKLQNKKDTEQAISDVLKYIELKKGKITKSDDYIF